MAEIIQFHCPACGTMLRLPLAMAAQQGPCPTCDRIIVAPDPHLGLGAFEIPLPPPPREIEPFKPFAEPPLAVEMEQEARPVEISEVVPSWPTAAKEPVGSVPRSVLVLSCLLTGLIALILGYGLGSRSVQPAPQVPRVEQAAKLPEARSPIPPPVQVDQPVDPPKVAKPPGPVKVSAAAEASLQAFLEAPDWAARSAYVLYPGKLRSAMEAYSRVEPDGPTPFKSISVKQSQIDDETGSTVFIFYVKTDKFPQGIPVAVRETPVGWLVDWETFIEFRDELFQKFVDGPIDQPGRFHLIVSAPPKERAANTENEHFSSFLLQSPLSREQMLAFVKKDSEAFTAFQEATADGGIFTPVLEVVKRKTADGQTYFEVLKVTATDWLPREN